MSYPLPWDLAAAIEREAQALGPGTLAGAVEEISRGYRQGTPPAFADPARRVAYAAVRMPATYAALCAVLRETVARVPGEVRSLLDLGAGTGAAAWAAATVFGALDRITLLEHDDKLIDFGRKLGVPPPAEWQWADVRRATPFPSHDLVTLAWLSGELDEADARRIVREAWSAARRAVVIVEPGTPRGFAKVRALREELIAAGARVAAPCPHDSACPVVAPDWCHFSERVERTSLHRRLKGGSLGYEDEKYSYVVASKEAPARAAARVLRHPLIQPGWIRFDLCTPSGIEGRAVTKRDKDAWRAARRARWGGAL